MHHAHLQRCVQKWRIFGTHARTPDGEFEGTCFRNPIDPESKLSCLPCGMHWRPRKKYGVAKIDGPPWPTTSRRLGELRSAQGCESLWDDTRCAVVMSKCTSMCWVRGGATLGVGVAVGSLLGASSHAPSRQRCVHLCLWWRRCGCRQGCSCSQQAAS